MTTLTQLQPLPSVEDVIIIETNAATAKIARDMHELNELMGELATHVSQHGERINQAEVTVEKTDTLVKDTIYEDLVPAARSKVESDHKTAMIGGAAVGAVVGGTLGIIFGPTGVIAGAAAGSALGAGVTGAVSSVVASEKQKHIDNIVKQMDNDEIVEGNSCHLCTQKFTTFSLRKHRCRVCRKPVCYYCSLTKVDIVIRGLDKPVKDQRACDQCAKLPRPIVGKSLQN